MRVRDIVWKAALGHPRKYIFRPNAFENASAVTANVYGIKAFIIALLHQKDTGVKRTFHDGCRVSKSHLVSSHSRPPTNNVSSTTQPQARS